MRAACPGMPLVTAVVLGAAHRPRKCVRQWQCPKTASSAPRCHIQHTRTHPVPAPRPHAPPAAPARLTASGEGVAEEQEAPRPHHHRPAATCQPAQPPGARRAAQVHVAPHPLVERVQRVAACHGAGRVAVRRGHLRTRVVQTRDSCAVRRIVTLRQAIGRLGDERLAARWALAQGRRFALQTLYATQHTRLVRAARPAMDCVKH